MESSNSVQTTLHFYAPPVDGSAPEFRVIHASGLGTKNYGHNPVQVTIQDIRQCKSRFSLERNSFQAVSSPIHTLIDFDDSAEVERLYYPEIMDLLMNHVGDVKYVFIFDHCVRKVTIDKSKQRPVRKVHVDQTPKAALARYQLHVPEVARDLYEGERVRLINIWRPIKGPVSDHHLAVANSQTLERDDLVEIAHIYPERVGETYGVKHNPKQEYWYLSDMTVDEALLLQCYDSSSAEVCCAHASFRDDSAADKTNFRESIEVRCLVIG